MKRNNLLMLSFIILITVCALAKSFWDYPMWITVVSAITVASWLFALADLCFSQASAHIKMANEQLGDTEDSLTEVEMISKAVDRRIVQLKNDKNYEESSLLHTKEDEIQYLSSVKSDLEDIGTGLQSYKDLLEKGQKGANTNKVWGCVITVLGFLVFFLTIIFNPLMEAPAEGLDEMTVWAFAIILFTQYMETLLEERREKKKQKSQKIVNALDALRKKFESEVKYNAD